MTDVAADVPARPSPWGDPLGEVWLRASPEDFRVAEIPLVRPSGVGEHLLVHVRKRGLTTQAVAKALARACRVSARAVSYAGMKDRHAVTEQWLSVHLPGRDTPAAADLDLPAGVEVLGLWRHGRKLKTGALRGNTFRVRLRGEAVMDPRVSARLGAIGRRGVPNYFGAQRFGRDGDNVAQARALFRGERRARDRRERGILLSAARSHLFNRVLAARVASQDWDRAVVGDRMILDGRGSVFSAASEPAASLARRTALGEVHPTGPLAGRPRRLPGDESLPAVESGCLEEDQELVEGLAAAGVDAARRALRVRVTELGWWFPEPAVLEVAFALPPGAYATTVLDQVFRLREPA